MHLPVFSFSCHLLKDTNVRFLFLSGVNRQETNGHSSSKSIGRRYREYASDKEKQHAYRVRHAAKFEQLKNERQQLTAENERMKKADGSLFDLHQSTPKEIFDVLKSNMSSARFAVLEKLFHDKPPRKVNRLGKTKKEPSPATSFLIKQPYAVAAWTT